MRIVILCHYFWPEIGAPSARLLAFAKKWVKMGHDVQVVTCFPNHPTGEIPLKYRRKLYARETYKGITIHRTYVFATPNKGFLKKVIGHISFMISSMFALGGLGKVDTLVVSSPTFFSIFSGLFMSKCKKSKFVLEVRDLWPAAIVALGVLKNKMIIRALEVFEHYFYRKCDKLVVVSESFKKTIVENVTDVAEDKIIVITNGYDSDIFHSDRMRTYDCKIGPTNMFVVTYVGAFGMSQNLMTILKVALKLRTENIQFVMVGEGAEKEKLKKYALENSLEKVLFVNEQPKEKIIDFYNVSDVCLVPLKNVDLFQSFIPSKIFEIMGCGVPIVASLKGESAKIVEESGSGIVVEPDNVNEICEAILLLMENAGLRERMSKRGKEFAKTRYDREMLAQRYFDEVLNSGEVL